MKEPWFCICLVTHQFYFPFQNFNEDEDEEGFPEEIKARLVTRPEDLPENAAASIQRYKDLMLRMLEVQYIYNNAAHFSTSYFAGSLNNSIN